MIKAGKRKKKRIETSKAILIVTDLIAAATAAAAIVCVFKLQTAEPLQYLIPSAFGLAATAHGFYFWKAKAENLHKYGQDSKITMDGSSDQGSTYEE